MKKFRLIGLLLPLCFSLHAQQKPMGFPKNKFADIFHSYQWNQSEFYGIFDSVSSVFYLHSDTVFQSQFDSNCLLGHGKTWHLNQVVSFTSYLTIDTVFEVEKSTDSSEELFWPFELPEFRKKSVSLWKCEGEFSINEKIEDSFSGKFIGTFGIYFIYDNITGMITELPSDKGFGLEPGYLFSGFWKSYKHPRMPSISFFVANTKPRLREDGVLQLPDLRFQFDGNSSYSNIVTFEHGIPMPALKWYQ